MAETENQNPDLLAASGGRPSTIGPLHGAGVADGIRWAKETIDAAMAEPEAAKEK